MNEISPLVIAGMNLEGTMLSEVRQRQILYEFPYMYNLKKNVFKQNKTNQKS